MSAAGPAGASAAPRGDRFLARGQQYLPGIYGGVGPLSHTLFEQLVLEASGRRGATTDQDHPVWLLASASSTPNRMRSLSGEGEPAEPFLRHFARLLESAGADALFVVCNTAHAYHQAVQRDLRIPWIHLMDITVEWIRRHSPHVERVGVVGTDGTLQTGLYAGPSRGTGCGRSRRRWDRPNSAR